MGLKIDCNTADSFKKSFANGNLTIPVRDMVLAHVYKCKECREIYRNYYMKIGKKFHIYNEMFKFLMDNEMSSYGRNSYVKEIIESNDNLKKRYADFVGNKWTKYAETGDIPKLTTLVAFKEVMDMDVRVPNEDSKERDDIVEALYKYGLYEAKKIAKKVDMLERCLVLEPKGDNDD